MNVVNIQLWVLFASNVLLLDIRTVKKCYLNRSKGVTCVSKYDKP